MCSALTSLRRLLAEPYHCRAPVGSDDRGWRKRSPGIPTSQTKQNSLVVSVVYLDVVHTDGLAQVHIPRTHRRINRCLKSLNSGSSRSSNFNLPDLRDPYYLQLVAQRGC